MKNNQAIYSYVCLFSGAGGFTEGMLLAGNAQSRFNLVAASDIHPHAGLTHIKRFKEQIGIDYSFFVRDIRSDELITDLLGAVKEHSGRDKVDVVVGGPPCQGFSVFGLRREDDPRNDLFLPYLRIIEKLLPKYFVMENVPGLKLMYGGKTVKRIFDEVLKMGPVKYGLTGPILVNAADYGVPQLRERIIFIGHREDMSPINEIPPSHKGKRITVKEAIDDLSFLRPWQNNGSYDINYPSTTKYQKESREGRLFKKLQIRRTDNELSNHEAARHTPDVMARFAMIEHGKGLESIPRELWDAHLKTSKKWCIRLDPNSPSFTMVTLPDDFVHYRWPRILTVREIARLQSFDDTFVFYGPRASGGGGKGNKKRNKELPQYTQVGNAVPPLLAKAIGEVLLMALNRGNAVDLRNFPGYNQA